MAGGGRGGSAAFWPGGASHAPRLVPCAVPQQCPRGSPAGGGGGGLEPHSFLVLPGEPGSGPLGSLCTSQPGKDGLGGSHLTREALETCVASPGHTHPSAPKRAPMALARAPGVGTAPLATPAALGRGMCSCCHRPPPAHTAVPPAHLPTVHISGQGENLPQGLGCAQPPRGAGCPGWDPCPAAGGADMAWGVCVTLSRRASPIRAWKGLQGTIPVAQVAPARPRARFPPAAVSWVCGTLRGPGASRDLGGVHLLYCPLPEGFTSKPPSPGQASAPGLHGAGGLSRRSTTGRFGEGHRQTAPCALPRGLSPAAPLGPCAGSQHPPLSPLCSPQDQMLRGYPGHPIPRVLGSGVLPMWGDAGDWGVFCDPDSP